MAAYEQLPFYSRRGRIQIQPDPPRRRASEAEAESEALALKYLDSDDQWGSTRQSGGWNVPEQNENAQANEQSGRFNFGRGGRGRGGGARGGNCGGFADRPVEHGQDGFNYVGNSNRIGFSVRGGGGRGGRGRGGWGQPQPDGQAQEQADKGFSNEGFGQRQPTHQSANAYKRDQPLRGSNFGAFGGENSNVVTTFGRGESTSNRGRDNSSGFRDTSNQGFRGNPESGSGSQSPARNQQQQGQQAGEKPQEPPKPSKVICILNLRPPIQEKDVIGLMHGKGLVPILSIWRPQGGAPIRAALLAEFDTLDDSTRAVQELQNFEMFDQKYSAIFSHFPSIAPNSEYYLKAWDNNSTHRKYTVYGRQKRREALAGLHAPRQQMPSLFEDVASQPNSSKATTPGPQQPTEQQNTEERTETPQELGESTGGQPAEQSDAVEPEPAHVHSSSQVLEDLVAVLAVVGNFLPKLKDLVRDHSSEVGGTSQEDPFATMESFDFENADPITMVAKGAELLAKKITKELAEGKSRESIVSNTSGAPRQQKPSLSEDAAGQPNSSKATTPGPQPLVLHNQNQPIPDGERYQMSQSNQNLNKPEDAFEQPEEEQGSRQCHIRIQPAPRGEHVTIVQGIDPSYDLEWLLPQLVKKHRCGGTVVEHPEYGKVIQLPGDQRQDVKDFLCKVGIVKEENCKIHGFYWLMNP